MHYPAEFPRVVVLDLLAADRSVAQAAHDLGISGQSDVRLAGFVN